MAENTDDKALRVMRHLRLAACVLIVELLFLCICTGLATYRIEKGIREVRRGLEGFEQQFQQQLSPGTLSELEKQAQEMLDELYRR